jgi:epoxyqueuosine reductase QueG
MKRSRRIDRKFSQTICFGGDFMPNGIPRSQTRRSDPAKDPQTPYATRPQRRKALKEIIQKLEAIIAAEKRYVDNAPLNLQASFKYEEAEQTVAFLEEALDILADAF